MLVENFLILLFFFYKRVPYNFNDSKALSEKHVPYKICIIREN